MKNFKKRPSPAMIVAVTALFISLVGTAFAGPIAEISGLNKKDKRTVRKISRNISGKVSNRRITKRAPGLNVATARNAVIANVANAANFAHTATDAQNAENAENAENADNADQLDGKSINDIVMWAFVEANGVLVRSSGGVTSSKQGAGDYDVSFPRNVDSCAYTATNSAPDNVGPATGETAAALTGPAATTDTVTVRTANSEGTLNDDQFMLQVTC